MSDGTAWDLAQLNIGRLLAPTDHPDTKGFMDALDPVNELADTHPGFRWRLQTEDGNATALRPYEDDLMIVNMSTWASLEALADFVYGEEHRAIMVQRRKWFERMEVYLVLWWVPTGHRPSVDEAKARLAQLEEDGPTPAAFTFRQPFPAPDAVEQAEADDRWGCSV
jgi:heme-degrading monooxygenase HmoA